MIAQVTWTYSLLMLAAIVVCGALLRRSQERLPLTSREKFGIGVGAFCGAMLGAKLPFVLADWDGLRSGIAWFSHGKTIMCGIVGGYFGVELAKWILEIRIKTGDSFAAPVAVAVAIGRLACFEAGCCFGTPTSLPWGVSFASAGDFLPRHPTQIYEAIFHGLAALLLLALANVVPLKGQLIKLYILSYLAYRFVTEFLRPEPKTWWELTAYQWAALALAPIFIGLWMRDANRFRAIAAVVNPDPSGHG